jgi:hypothetical protein
MLILVKHKRKDTMHATVIENLLVLNHPPSQEDRSVIYGTQQPCTWGSGCVLGWGGISVIIQSTICERGHASTVDHLVVVFIGPYIVARVILFFVGI